MSIKFSIITITKNNKSGLARTLGSIRMQIFRDYELIVVDANSDDGTDQIIFEYEDIVGLHLNDTGRNIYTAMNLGVKNASGSWLIFMNSGDCFYDENSLGRFEADNSCEIVHGIARRNDGNIHLPYREDLPFWQRMPISHQVIFFNKSIMTRRGFDESFKIAADFEYLIWAKMNGVKFKFIDVDIAVIEGGGVSETKVFIRIWESYRAAIKYFPKLKVHFFYLIKFLNTIKYKILICA